MRWGAKKVSLTWSKRIIHTGKKTTQKKQKKKKGEREAPKKQRSPYGGKKKRVRNRPDRSKRGQGSESYTPTEKKIGFGDEEKFAQRAGEPGSS